MIPDYLLKVSETLLRNVYLYYYPEILENPDMVEWGIALLDLLREWEDTAEDGWKYRVPMINSQAESRKSYILAATPDFQEQTKE